LSMSFPILWKQKTRSACADRALWLALAVFIFRWCP